MTVMTTWDLFDDLRSAQDELMRQSRMPSRWAGQLGQQPGTGPAVQAWAPAVDITERKDAYLVAAELPGVGTDDLEITFQDSAPRPSLRRCQRLNQGILPGARTDLLSDQLGRLVR